MIEKLRAIVAALYLGEKLTHAEIWKQRQTLLNALLALLGAVSVWFPVEVSADDQRAIAGGVAALAGVFNAYLATATSASVGLSGGLRNPQDMAGSTGRPIDPHDL